MRRIWTEALRLKDKKVDLYPERGQKYTGPPLSDLHSKEKRKKIFLQNSREESFSFEK